MHTTRKILTTGAITAALALGGVVGAHSLAAASYGGESPPSERAPDTGETETPDDAPDTGAAPENDDAPENDETQPLGVQATDSGSESEPGDEGEGRRRGGCRGDAEAIATALGITTDELREAREAGQSLAAIAADEGVPVEMVVEAIVDAKGARLAEDVAEGELTQAEADERLADAHARATEKVNNVPGGPEGAPEDGQQGTADPSSDAG